MSGFVVLYREALDHPLLRDPSRLGAWVWLISKAAWKPTRFDVRGKIITLDRGQLSISYRGLAKEWGWSIGTVQRFIDRLKTDTMIDTTSDTGRMIVTICNYSKYQDVNKEADTVADTPTDTEAIQKRYIKEQGNKGTSIKEKNTKKEKSVLPSIVEKPVDVDDDVWSDFINHRKKKKAEITQTAMKGILREADKAGWSLNDVLIEIVARGWIGFNSDWVENGNTDRKINNTKPASYDGLGEAFREIARSGINQSAENDGQRTSGAKIFMLADAKA